MGFLTWGSDTAEIVTENLPSKGFQMIINVCLVAKALLSYPLPFYQAAALLIEAVDSDALKTEYRRVFSYSGKEINQVRKGGKGWEWGVGKPQLGNF